MIIAQMPEILIIKTLHINLIFSKVNSFSIDPQKMKILKCI